LFTKLRVRSIFVVATILAMALVGANLATRPALGAPPPLASAAPSPTASPTPQGGNCPTISNRSGANQKGANLAGCNLSGYDFSGANLSNANFNGANLSSANLKGANLQGATLIGADLSSANLKGANLQGATLTGATLSGADLSGANLNGDSLQGANATGAMFNGANLNNGNLNASNLTKANFTGANTNHVTCVGAIVTDAVAFTCSPGSAVITSFAASPTSISAGSSSQLTAVFSGGTGSIDNSVGAVTSNTPVTVKPSTTTTYTLTVDNGSGGKVTSTATVTVDATPVITSFGASPTSITAGGSSQLTAVFSGGTGSIDNSVGAVTSNTPVTVKPSTTTTYTLTVDNGAGGKVTQTATVTVTATPVITSFGASPTSITAGGSSQLTAVFSGGTGSIDNGGGAATSGSPITITPSTTTTYTLTVDNGSGGKVTSTATVTVVAVPVITSFVASPSSVTAGSGAQLTAVFSGGAGSVDNGVGPVTSGSGVKVTPSATTTYTLTVDNGSGGKVTSPATVTVTGTGIGEGTSISLSAGNNSPAVGQSVNFTATVTPPGSTGKVGFGIDSPMITNTVPLDTNSTASMPISFNTSGTHTIYVVYIDSNGSFGGASGGVENSVTVTAVGTPVITSFGAKPASIATGATTQLTAVFSGGTGSIDNSVGTVTSGTPVTVSPSATTTYTLTVDNGAGVKVTSTATVTVAGVEGTAVALSLDSIQPVVGQPTTFTATVTPKGATGSVQLITFTVGSPLGNPVQLDANSQATLTYTFGQASNQGVEAAYTDSNGIIVAYSQVVNFSVAPAPGPAITSFVAASSSIPVGGSTQLTAVFSGGTGSISNNVDSSVIPVTSGMPVTVSPSTTTTYTLTVIDGTGTTVTSQVTIAVGAVEGTAISLTSDIITPAVGQPVTFTATVTPAGATGSVRFGVDSNTQLSNPVPLDANSSATLTQIFTTAGGHQIYAYYTDSAGNNAGKTFVNVSVTAGKGGPVITSFGVSPNSPTSIAVGGSTQLTAVFSGGAGNIDNGVGAVTSGTPLKVSPVTTTTYTLTVDDGVGDKVTSQTTVTVQQVEGTGISLAQDIPSPAVGQTVTFTATVTPAGATGSVGFQVADQMIFDTVPLGANSTAPFPVTFTTPGPHTINAQYVDSAGQPGVSTSITVTVSGQPVVESFNAKPSTISAGQSTQLTATFAGGTGTINPGSISITSGTPVPINPTTTTTYTLTVDGGANGTATSQTTVTINGVEGTAMTLALNPGQTLVVGSPATFTATVTPLGATGTVGLIDNIIGVGNPVPLDANSTAQITVTLESSGFNTFVASYIDSNGNFGVSSNELFLGVSATQPGPSIDSFSASPQVVPAGGSTQLTAFFSNGTGSIDNGVGAVTSGIPVTVTPNGTSTTYTLTVTGPGGTTSATTTVATGVEGTAISVTSDVSSPVIGQAVNFTATVTPTGATGSVGFGKNIPQISTTVPLNTNSTATTATYQTSFAAAGPHTIYVFYIDSAGNTVAQSSITVTVTVVSGGGGGGGGIEGNAIALTQTSSAVAGQPVSFTATVTPTGAAGKAGLSLDSGQTFVDSAVLDSTGAATLTATFSTSGTYTVYAYYFDSSGNPAAKTFIQVTVN
jgi:uncharacterized protein YjbI with pentapeptide repeats